MRTDTTSVLRELRALMAQHNVDAYLVPSEDAHNSEYIAARDMRRAFISGFTGSAGHCAIVSNAAALFTDGRYHAQAADEIDGNWELMRVGDVGVLTLDEWLAKQLPQGSRVGYDPQLASVVAVAALEKDLAKSGLELVPVTPNLIDEIWDKQGRPALPQNPIFPLALKYSGQSTADKIAALRKKLVEKKRSCFVVSSLDELAWVFNLRGADISYNPVFFGFGLISQTEAILYANEPQLTAEARESLSENGVTVRPYDAFLQELSKKAETLKGSGAFWVGEACSMAVASVLPSDQLCTEVSEITHMKAIKNPVELEGMRQCHIRDAVALCEFFNWLENRAAEASGADIGETEMTVSDKLEAFRKQQKDFVTLSFPTISGMGPNGAIIHYHVQPDTCRAITKDNMFLLDSGAQYLDGTTDVTRTVHLGEPTEYQKFCFTQVLKGHIDLGRMKFPTGTNGYSLDAFARQHLWAAGLNYKHGTGHGVGSFLNVHEGPIGIGTRQTLIRFPLKPGMIVTNEPGYYEAGQFGIRIENVIEVKSAQLKHNFAQTGFMEFGNVTLFPIQAKLIDVKDLAPAQLQYLNEYHATCRRVLSPVLQEQGRHEALAWLLKQTEPL